MRIVGLAEIRAALDPDAAITAVRDAIRRFARGEAQQAAVGHLGFTDPPGDVHVKSAWLRGDPVYVVKLASTFYDNPRKGLPPGSGLMLVANARTGEPVALLQDQGELTDLRTAMAGAIAAEAIGDPTWTSPTLGVIGAGVQAELQARWIARTLRPGRILVWARRPQAARELAARLGDLAAAVELRELAVAADLIVTTTPARTPILEAQMLRPGYRIVAVGADAPGKRELGAGVVAGADLVVADSAAQALDHGECAGALAEGLNPGRVIELGAILAVGARLRPGGSAVADLTGLGVQDAAIARVVWDRVLQSSPKEQA